MKRQIGARNAIWGEHIVRQRLSFLGSEAEKELRHCMHRKLLSEYLLYHYVSVSAAVRVHFVIDDTQDLLVLIFNMYFSIANQSKL